MHNLNLKKGIGLLELMLSIIVITAVILGATKYYLVAREAARITQAQDIINTAAEAAYKWVEGHSDFSGITTQVLFDAGLLPHKYLEKNMDPWGGGMIQIFADTSHKPSYPWVCVRFGSGPRTDIPQKSYEVLAAKYGKCPAAYREQEEITSCADYVGNHDFYFRAP